MRLVSARAFQIHVYSQVVCHSLHWHLFQASHFVSQGSAPPSPPAEAPHANGAPAAGTADAEGVEHMVLDLEGLSGEEMRAALLKIGSTPPEGASDTDMRAALKRLEDTLEPLRTKKGRKA